jgi:hypothetical protein
MTKNHKNTTLIFFITNFFFFLTILFSYLVFKDSKESIVYLDFLDNYPAHNIFTTLAFCFTTLFIVSLIYNFFINQKNKNLIFSIYFYFLLLSSGFYLINLPIIDELIMISSSFFFALKKRDFAKYSYKDIIILLLFFLLLLQSIVGLIHSIKSIRYIVIFLSLIVSFIYFSSHDFINQKKEERREERKSFLNYIFYAVIVSYFFQFFFWYLKFYVLEFKEADQFFLGSLQPALINSAAGHMEAFQIMSVYLILYYTIISKYIFRRIILFFLLILMWKMADSRAALLLAIICSIFYFYIVSCKIKFIIILFLILTFSIENNFLSSIPKIVYRVIDAQKVEAPLENSEYADPVYGDINRFAYGFSPILKFNIHNNYYILYGCGFYGYYLCNQSNLLEVFDDFGVNYVLKEGSLGTLIRPPALGTIIVENGLILIFTFLFIYFNFIFKNFFRNKIKIILSIFFFSIALIWSFFTNLMDIVYFYYLLMPFFYKKIYPDSK